MFVTSFLVVPICSLNFYEVNNRFVFLAVFTTATGKANFKDLADKNMVDFFCVP